MTFIKMSPVSPTTIPVNATFEETPSILPATSNTFSLVDWSSSFSFCSLATALL